MTSLTSDDFVAHVAAHGGVTQGRAATATRVVLSALGGYASAGQRQQIADELPQELRAAVLSPAGAAIPIEDRLLAPGEKVAHARELIASVCHVLAERLSTGALAYLRSVAPPDLAGYLAPPSREASPDERLAGASDTLAGGKPGSHHPIADTAAARAHDQSIASTNPHGATKLSSSPGTTQEREHDTLADAHADPRRQIASAKA